MKLVVNRLQHNTAHDALPLLKTCLGGPKLQYTLQVSPCCKPPLLAQFDEQRVLTKTCNIAIMDDQWTGGLGIRSVSMLASSAFVASAAGTLPLQIQILRNTQVADENTKASLKHWFSLSGMDDED